MMEPGVLILGLETSCDETSAAVVRDGDVILSNIIASQVELHARYGGWYRSSPAGLTWRGCCRSSSKRWRERRLHWLTWMR